MRATLGVFVVLLSATMLPAQRSHSTAALECRGMVRLNGTTSPPRTALHMGDWVQTERQSRADIAVEGSFIEVMPSSLVRYQGEQVLLSHGGVLIASSTRLTLRAHELVVIPATAKPTRFEAVDNGDSIVIVARAGELTVSEGGKGSILEEGQQRTYSHPKERQR